MLTQRVAEFVVETRTADVPNDVMDAARDALIDTLGVALVGSLDEVGEITLRYVNGLAARREATIWGTHAATSMAEAAFVNGVFGHALDFDDVHSNVHGHPSTTIVPAAMAAAEAFGASGEALLAAYAIGLDVAGKLGVAVGNGHYQRGWHATATMGVFASTAAVARLAGLTVPQLRHAFGLAASQASGMLKNFGTMTKPFHAGHAARCAVQAALLARAGFTADTSIFDGDDSFFRTYGEADKQPFEPLVDKLGKPWEAVDPGISYKRWPCCYCNHRAVGAMLELIKKHDIRGADVQAVEIGFPPGSDTALIHLNPKTGLEGKFSIEYVAAATLLDGKVGIDTFTDVMVNRPEIRAMMKNVKRYRIADPKMYSGSVGYNDVMVRTTKGEYRVREDRAPGSPQWPMSPADRDEKFLDCAGRVLGDIGARRVLELAVGARQLGSVAELARAMVPAQSAAKAPSSTGTVLAK
ncbi:MAG: MmgE/PrpD family protein [Betaproteobacteria bacterium]|nr:MAG: MmgE/PrpD family protein [Betaproteobacteria bacterium]